ncbi:hypothetical protein BT96DRAFT_952232, partial [Gymnopus androsaceus JB14]
MPKIPQQHPKAIPNKSYKLSGSFAKRATTLIGIFCIKLAESAAFRAATSGRVDYYRRSAVGNIPAGGDVASLTQRIGELSAELASEQLGYEDLRRKYYDGEDDLAHLRDERDHFFESKSLVGKPTTRDLILKLPNKIPQTVTNEDEEMLSAVVLTQSKPRRERRSQCSVSPCVNETQCLQKSYLTVDIVPPRATLSIAMKLRTHNATINWDYQLLEGAKKPTPTSRRLRKLPRPSNTCRWLAYCKTSTILVLTPEICPGLRSR